MPAYKDMKSAQVALMDQYVEWLEDISAGLMCNGVKPEEMHVTERKSLAPDAIIDATVYVKGTLCYAFQATYNQETYKIEITKKSGNIHPALRKHLARYGCGGEQLV